MESEVSSPVQFKKEGVPQDFIDRIISIKSMQSITVPEVPEEEQLCVLIPFHP